MENEIIKQEHEPETPSREMRELLANRVNMHIERWKKCDYSFNDLLFVLNSVARSQPDCLITKNTYNNGKI